MSTATPTTMSVKRQDLNPCTIQLEIVCAPEQVQAGFNKAIKQLSKRVKVPGFRPGMAPKKMVEEMIDPNALFNAAAEEIVRNSLQDALKQEDIKPDSQPSVELTKFEKDPAACEFTVKVPLAPKVEMGEYKGLAVEQEAVTVEDDEVERQLEEIRRRSGKKQEVAGRGIQEGDVAVVNIKLEGQEGDGRNFMVIAGQTFPGLDQCMVGMMAEEIKSAELDFPANFQEKDWAGQKHAAHVTIRSVSAVQIPDLDDSFAKSLNLENVDDLRARVREGIHNAKSQIAREMLYERLLDQLLSKSTIHVADTTWESVASRRLSEIHQELQQKGSNIEDYAKSNGMTLDEFVAAQRQEAKTHVERAVMIEKIFTAEGMKITDRDANDHFLQIAAENQVPQEELEKFAKQFGPQLRDEVIFRAMYGKVMAFLAESAQVTEVASTAAKPAKAAPKKAKASGTKTKDAK